MLPNTDIFNAPEGEEDHHAYHTIFEKKVTEAISPFQGYIKSQAMASIILLVCTITALIFASLPTTKLLYEQLITTELGIFAGDLRFAKTLQFWTNDVLLTIFFFFVGLEIKREFLVGELNDHKRALFVVCAAIGGMIVPALIYYLINYNTRTAFGWGIPMATDTAFALGILTLFKNKLSRSLFSFLAALAIIDDIGAILVIAIFYSTSLNAGMLFISLLFCGVLFLMNYAGIRKSLPYFLIGFLVWGTIEYANIHGTVAGIMVALLIPARPRRGPKHFVKKTKELIKRFEQRKEEKPLILEDQRQHEVLEEVQQNVEQATTPLQRLEFRLEVPVALIVLPLFAFMNAGIPIHLELLNDIFVNRVSLGILFALVIGKPAGILLFSWLSHKSGIATPPEEASFTDFFSVLLLTGIGFTMSIFISSLSFADNAQLLTLSKAAIVLGSLISGLLGIILLTVKKPIDKNP